MGKKRGLSVVERAKIATLNKEGNMNISLTQKGKYEKTEV